MSATSPTRALATAGSPITLTAGQTWYEGPDDVHVVSRNASKTAPAKYLVVLVKGKGAPILTRQVT